jgi:hypothetical protein
MKQLLLALTLLFGISAGAEQMRRLGNWDVHYVLIPTMFLNKDIAANNQIIRGRDRALLNISVIGDDGTPVAADVSGFVMNLLGQQQALDIVEVREGSAIYYLATLKYTDREVLSFEVTITPPDDIPQVLKFQQQVYWEEQ